MLRSQYFHLSLGVRYRHSAHASLPIMIAIRGELTSEWDEKNEPQVVFLQAPGWPLGPGVRPRASADGGGFLYM